MRRWLIAAVWVLAACGDSKKSEPKPEPEPEPAAKAVPADAAAPAAAPIPDAGIAIEVPELVE